MKKKMAILLLSAWCLSLGACSGVGWEEVKREGASYENFQHMWFSMTHGSDSEVTEQDARKSQEQGWYGEPIEYVGHM